MTAKKEFDKEELAYRDLTFKLAKGMIGNSGFEIQRKLYKFGKEMKTNTLKEVKKLYNLCMSSLGFCFIGFEKGLKELEKVSK